MGLKPGGFRCPTAAKGLDVFASGGGGRGGESELEVEAVADERE
jgi:hypothetical protein